ncbi:hypothetical protein [Sinorhizobium medicae]
MANRAARLFAVPLLLSATSALALDCPDLCTSGSADCLIVRNEVSDADAKAGLSWLHQILANPSNQTIKSTDLLHEFKIANDPCNRSDTNVTAGGTLTNTGDECKVGGAMTLAGGTLSAHVLVPKKLNLSFASSGEMVVVETHADSNATQDELAVVLFSSPSFQEDWGGVVKRVWFKQDESIIEARACIRFIY